MILNNQITLGELFSFYYLLSFFTGPATSLIGFNKTFQNALIATDRLFEILDLKKEDLNSGPAIGICNSVIFETVTFGYSASSVLFTDLSFNVSQNKVTAIVGESGSGKSTLISLFQKLYPIHSGSIMIDDRDVNSCSTESIRHLISVVPQRIELFPETISANIALGQDKPDLAKIESICERLGLTSFIRKLPNGLKTHIGERGITLSGGQQQRIAIARALYKDHQILILDEPTASLDAASEEYVNQTIRQEISDGKTVILISHKLSTVRHADHIIVLKNGAVAEQGCHEVLFAKGGEYFSMWGG